VLIIDDDIELCELLATRMSDEGFEIEAVHDGPRGFERALSREDSLVVLDLMVPGVGGLDVLRRVREQSPIPVMILTARGEDVDRILGLEIGADDYLPKPFNPRELIARIRAILQRSVRLAARAHPLVDGNLRLDPASREARIHGRLISLTSVEFALLEMCMRARRPHRHPRRTHRSCSLLEAGTLRSRHRCARDLQAILSRSRGA
jgi:two-component system response regulator CpxR